MWAVYRDSVVDSGLQQKSMSCKSCFTLRTGWFLGVPKWADTGFEIWTDEGVSAWWCIPRRFPSGRILVMISSWGTFN